jgi:DNA/RNA-binding domain of Phe-tRNA-synthetase-like protein
MHCHLALAADVAERYPDYRGVVVAATGVRNGPSRPAVRQLLADSASAARHELGNEPAASHPRLSVWREAYASFGVKPSRYYCSAEALARRAQSNRLASVNELVDLYNAISLRYLLPIGGEDCDRIQGNYRLRFATGQESSDIGDLGRTTPEPGEPIWADDLGVTCRRWNWRQGRRTALSQETTSALFVIDVLGRSAEKVVERAVTELIRSLRANFCAAEVYAYELPIL